METSQQTEQKPATRITCGAIAYLDRVLYTVVEWPSGVTIAGGVARSRQELFSALLTGYPADNGSVHLPIALVAAVVGYTRQNTEDWFRGTVPTRWVDTTKCIVGGQWTFSTRNDVVILRTCPNADRPLVTNIAQLANVLLDIEQTEETSPAWRAMDAGYKASRVEREMSPGQLGRWLDAAFDRTRKAMREEPAKTMPTATADALTEPTARELEQRRRYQEILRETLLVEAFKVLLPRSVDGDIDNFGPELLAKNAVEYVDALMDEVFDPTEVSRG